MRGIATCYSDQAVKISDSYCSSYPNRSYVSPRLSPPARNAVVSTYKLKLSPQTHLHITFTWSAKLLCRGFWIRVTRKPASGQPDSALRNMAADKGRERFTACGSTLRVHWDLSNARFLGPGPEPVGSFYVVVLVDSVLGLLLGDMEEDPSVQKLTFGLPPGKSSLVSHCEYLSGSTQFSTRARFCDSGRVHEVAIRCGEEGGDVDPGLTVLIDKRPVVRVRRLNWNFRGNQVVFVDGLLVDVMWDVSRWIAEDDDRSTVGDGFFMFRTRSGLDSSLWFEEERLAQTNHDKVEFSFLVCASRKLG